MVLGWSWGDPGLFFLGWSCSERVEGSRIIRRPPGDTRDPTEDSGRVQGGFGEDSWSIQGGSWGNPRVVLGWSWGAPGAVLG